MPHFVEVYVKMATKLLYIHTGLCIFQSLSNNIEIYSVKEGIFRNGTSFQKLFLGIEETIVLTGEFFLKKDENFVLILEATRLVNLCML